MANIQINDFTITEFVGLDAYLRTNGMLDFALEELQELTVDATQDKTELTGKNGRIIGYKKQNKAINVTGTVGIISAGLMKTQTGGDITNGEFNVKKSETKTVSGTTLVTDAKAEGTAGAEIGFLKVMNANGSTEKVYEQATSADATHFSYDPSTKTITLPTDTGAIADGTTVVYAYERKVDATRVNDPSDKFSEVREVWIHCFGTDACDNEYYADLYIPRADFSGEFSLDLVGDQTVHNFSFDGMADLCAKNGSSDLFQLFIYTK